MSERELGSQGHISKEYVENKEVLQRVLECVDKQSLEEIKIVLKDVEKDIVGKKNAYAQFHDLKDLLNTIRDGNGRYPLHFVASRGDIAIFDYLISLGADHMLEDNEKNTSFFICA